MTNEEAIEILLSIKNNGSHNIEVVECEGIDIAIQALEKQIAKKIIFSTNFTPICPNCKDGNIFGVYGEELSYCDGCGQKLEWSD